jgi:hypothetical protein
VNIFQHDGQRRAALPSWVPEFDRHFNLRRSLSFLGLKGYSTTGSVPITIEAAGDADSLSLYGALIDTVNIPDGLEGETLQVRRSAGTQTRELIFNSSTVGIKHLWKWLNRQECRYPAGEDLLEAFVLTLICCREDQQRRTTKSSARQIVNLIADFAAYWKRAEPDFGSLPPRSNLYASPQELEQLSSSGSAAGFGQRLMWTCDSRRLLVTQNKWMGMFPRQAAPGDLIAVLFGSNVPWVIRRIEPSAAGHMQSYRLIGECYVHGQMDGSVIGELNRGILSAQLLNLR